VDVSLEVLTRICVVAAWVGFNPCSRGCFARSGHQEGDQCHDASFNPCSRGCFARRSSVKYSAGWIYQFQSLFSWMFRSKSIAPSIMGMRMGFNPCSRGCFARSCLSNCFYDKMGMFQSLFSWMFRSKQTSFFIP